MITTLLHADDQNGELEICNGLQIVDETNIKEINEDQNRVEILDDDINNNFTIR